MSHRIGTVEISIMIIKLLWSWLYLFVQQEYELLYYSLSSARIFFRADLTAAEEKEAQATGKMTDLTGDLSALMTDLTEDLSVLRTDLKGICQH